ncbi:uncharacterized protein P174DRAFT_452081 [Aspergillus novofumigatus IBT 16806]|uniref:MARVEL domain-containing protein n=1 Tax=Aspergillus novofumigatus (strain IBT 16806) TaxID=1392255 RepID=A0A2I1C542_ASPN1|nr:uncharacterized protein P174DRAFT_452081 [Aspergillus novofumigatus IBT 16806]PKX92790.1 hypothetical protein P174DRAFT_452081 [Aspergillus novofumigatus IBT 16806]
MNFAIENHPKIKLRAHIIIGVLLFLNFVLIIARIADKGTPKARSNTWGIVVCLKAAIFLAYQVATAHVERFKRWASAKAYMILNVIDTIFWFVLFIITILGTTAAHSTSSRALGGIVATISIILCGTVGFLTFICIRGWRYFKQYGVLPGTFKGSNYGSN